MPAWLVDYSRLPPIGVLGLLLKTALTPSSRSLWVVATMLIVFAVFLGLAGRFGREQRELKDLTFRHGIQYGLRRRWHDPGVFTFGRYNYRGSVHGLYP